MKQLRLRMIAMFLSLALCLSAVLTGCGPSNGKTPDTSDSTPGRSSAEPISSPEPASLAPAQDASESPDAEDTCISAEPAPTEASQVYIAAQFGAPVDGAGLFPLNADRSASLAALIDISPEALSECVPVEVSDWMPLVELTLADGSIVSFSRDGERIILHTAGQYFDYTKSIDFDKLCRTLEGCQLSAVLADLPELTRLNIDAPDVPSLNRDITLTPDESRFIWNTLQPDAWEIPDMYTAQDLARGWGDFVALYSGDIRMALIAQGDIQGRNRTVIFYQINGEEDQTAYILAPEDGYRTLFDWAQNR